MKGRPLRQRLRNFRPDPESAVRALGGPTHWMLRLRAIEDAIDQHERQLAAAWRELALGDTRPGSVRGGVASAGAPLELRRGERADRGHNRNFPAESRLPMDPRTRDFVRINGRSYEREPLDEAWILERFPADRNAAQAA